MCVLTVMMLVLPGCPPTQPTVKTTAQPAPFKPADDKDIPPALRNRIADPDDPDVIHMILLQLVTVQVPTGVASGSEELWSYLDEEPVSLRSTVLGLNGFRMGVGRSDVWKDLQRVLKKMTGQEQKTTHVQIFPGQVAPIVLKRKQPIQTIFTYFNDQTLSGSDYPPGDNLLTLTCGIDENHSDRILLTAVPQIRSTKKVGQISADHGAPKIAYRPKLYTLRPLTFQLTVGHNDFLIIGPGIEARRPSSIGHHFLSRTKAGMDYETVLVLRPRIFRLKLSR